MSTGIVEAPALGIGILLAAPVALPFALAGGALALSASAARWGVEKAGEYAAEMERKRLAIEKERRAEQEREIAAISKRLDALLAANRQSSPKGLSEDFIAKNRAYLFESLEEISDFSSGKLDVTKYAAPGEPGTNPPAPGDNPDFRKLTQEIFSNLAILDPVEANANRRLLSEIESGCPAFRGKIIFENIKITYANTLHIQARNIWRKKKLGEMAATLSGIQAQKFQDASKRLVRDGYVINDREFTELVKDYAILLEEELRAKSNALLAEQTAAQMRKLGYSPIGGASDGGPVYFNTPDSEYRIMSNVNPQNGQLSFRFVRVVGSEAEKKAASSAQKRRDLEKARKWCEKSRELLRGIEEAAGIKMTEIYRREPNEDEEVLVIVDQSLRQAEATAEEARSNASR